MKTFTRTIIFTILSLFLLSWVLHGITASSALTIVLAGLTISLLNLTVHPLLKMLFLPINVITMGTFNFLLNLFVLYIALWLVPGFQIWPIEILGVEFGQFWSLVIFSFALSFSNSLLSRVL
jgi:putative membrane protein